MNNLIRSNTVSFERWGIGHLKSKSLIYLLTELYKTLEFLQATAVNKNGTFPARFCVKITGRILSIDGGGNTSYLNTVIYYRTCVVDNIMESTKLLESSGNFRLKNFRDMNGTIRLQGVMSLCAFDGCNFGQNLYSSLSIIFISLCCLLCLYVDSITGYI